jgi:hypothetical protein
MIYLQNKVTGEIKDIDPDTQEYRDLIAERTEENKPVWEMQSDTAVAAKVERAEAGELRESDLPKNSPVVPERNRVEGFAAERAPWRNLTDAEREAGLDRDRKDAEELALADQSAIDSNAATKKAAAETIAASDTQRRGGQGVATDIPSGADEGVKETPEEAAKRQQVEQDEAAAGQGA